MKRNSILFGVLLVVLGSMFALGCRELPDFNPPTLLSSDPVDGEIGVSVDKAVSLTFSEQLDPASVNSTTCYIAGPVDTPVIVESEVLFDGITVVISPLLQLAPNTSYYAGCSAAIMDLDGNMAGMDIIGTFTTGDDTVAPSIKSVFPADLAVDVDDDAEVKIAFDEPIAEGSVNSENCYISKDGSPISAQLSVVGANVTLSPAPALEYNTVYTVTCGAGATDAYSNAAESGYSWSFTTIIPQ